ncbi:MAG: nicotinate (nicotinamide) nucleotide adenylyltransferase [Oscillospiraceae bacterium]|nr:nicotinate (nicotinamide) nucleotide adenylyltransferase [Oscillospiraceae bacterium]
MRVGIFGGTFNPPHIGHVDSAKAAVRQLGLDTLIVVPSGIPPHKSLPNDTPPADMRIHMTRTAFAELESAIVSDIEAMKPGVSYTVDTIEAIHEAYPNAELFLLIGTDMYLTLDAWQDSDTLLKTAIPAVFSRGPDDLTDITAYARSIQKRFNVHTETVTNNVIEISSSQLRDLLPKREGFKYINDTNYAYIIKNRLYGAKPDWHWLRSRAYSMLKQSRIPHVAGCEAEALRLAARWNVDADDAREAAILHDITKQLKPEAHVMLLEKYGVPSGTAKGEEKLLHAKSGAALAYAEFGVSDTVADAILWHTTGRANMSALEKVIYLADYIEPTRDFDGVDTLRSLAYEDLDKAMEMGLELSIQDMESRGITPNQTTFDALNDLRDNQNHQH